VPVDYSVGEKSFRAKAKTLSGGGVFLAATEGLEVGLDVKLHFRLSKNTPPLSTSGRVLYLHPEKGAGIEFISISEDDRGAILRFIHQKNKDRRANPRAPLATQVQCDQCLSLAFSRDISLGGMFVETTEMVPVDTLLTVRFNLDEKDQVVTANAQVIYHVEKMGMGIVFVDLGQHECEAIRQYLENAPAGKLPAQSHSA
jgi:c-di-GMP-binding flagellar brake protein YcgR